MRPSKTLRVVIDTNVVISGLFFGGNPLRVLNLVVRHQLIWLISPEAAAELVNKITKFTDNPGEIMEIINLVDAFGWRILPKTRVKIGRDQNDAKFLELAVDGRADYLITGDRDLLEICDYRGVLIVTPREFLKKHLP